MGNASILPPQQAEIAPRSALVLLSAKLKTAEGMIDARLRDLSCKGALIECRTTPPPGAEVTFERGVTSVAAHVAWSTQGRAGLEFHSMIDESELLVHIGRRAEPSAPVYRFKRSALTLGMNAMERKAVQAWSVAVGLTLPERGD